MNREQLLQYHRELCGKAHELMKRKNHDYAGAEGADPFANFRVCEVIGLCTTEQGMLVRLTDKLSRLSTFCDKGELLVKDESVEDTLVDIVNYAVLIGAVIQEKKVQTRCTPILTERSNHGHD